MDKKAAAEHDWHAKAEGKLVADDIDKTDLDAVHKSLTACVGGERLYLIWLKVERELQHE